MGQTLTHVLVFPRSDHFVQNIYPGTSEKVYFLTMTPVDRYNYPPLPSSLKWDGPPVDGPLVRSSITMRHKLVEVLRVNYVK
jgi:hypothetical protein